MSVELDGVNNILKTDTISEVTSANGVTIDGVNIKDSALVTAGSVPLSTIDIDGGTDIGAAIVDADLFIIDDGAGGTNRKVTASRVKTYAGVSGDVTTIDSLLKADIKIGEDDQTKIDFETADEIHLYAANAEQVYVADGIFGPQTDSDVDLGTTGVRWKDAYIDTITTTGTITTAGELDAATLDISGAVDIAGASVLHGLFTQDGGAVFNEASADVNFRVETDDITHMLFVLANKVGINEDTPEPVKGLTINSAAEDGGLISLKSSDVAHGITDLFETDTYGSIGKQDPTGGALNITGLGEGTLALRFLGVATNVSTNHSTGAEAPINLDARIKSGTGQGAVSADANLLRVTNAGANRFIIDEDGDIFHDGSASAFDTYDDAHLIRAHDLATSSPSSIIQSKFDDFLKYKKADLKKAGILDNLTEEQEAEGQVPFVNLMKLQKLHNGAIWQQYEKTEKLTHAMYELAKEAIGKRKADAILDKHEVKLLN